MRRLFPFIIAIVALLGAVTFALAQDATPGPGVGDSACATPSNGTPAAIAESTPAESASPVATPEACGSLAAEPFTIELVDIAFKPTDVTLPAGQSVKIELVNKGLALHNFSIVELNINVNLGPGQSETIELNAPAGDYEFICNIPGHAAAGMVGVLHLT